MENAFLEIRTVQQLFQIEEIAMFAHPIERLVKRGQTLLAVEDQERVRVAIKRRSASEFPTSEVSLTVTDTKNAASSDTLMRPPPPKGGGGPVGNLYLASD